jgi:uridine kinase
VVTQGLADGLDGYDIVASARIVGKDLCLSNYDIPDALDIELLLEHLHLLTAGQGAAFAVLSMLALEAVTNRRSHSLTPPPSPAKTKHQQ